MKNLLFVLVLFVSGISFGQGSFKVAEMQAMNGKEIDREAYFPNGDIELMKFVTKNFKIEEDEVVEGKIVVSFIVEADGTLTKIGTESKIDKNICNRIVAIMKKSPLWIPGSHDGRNVRSTYSFPLVFK